MGLLEGRVAVITGGTRGIGRAVALSFMDEGAKVAVSYVSDEDAAREFLGLAQPKGHALTVKADVTDPRAVEALFAKANAELGSPGILVNNAGTIKDGFLMLMAERDFESVVRTSLMGTFNCCKAAVRGMIAAKHGRIINMASPSATTGRAGQTNYAAAKGGVISLTRSLAREVARFGITVNAISPGVVETELTAGLDEKVRAELAGLIPLGRFGSPSEVARAAVFLASADAAYITGQVLAVDGGIAM